jgi:hypothetical protein
MTVETALYPSQLNTAWPLAPDLIAEGDDHIRLTKLVIKTTLPNIAGVVTPTHTELNYVAGVTSGIQAQFTAKAAKAGDTYTGAHNFTGATLTSATPAVGNSTTLAATTAYVQGEVCGQVHGLVWSGNGHHSRDKLLCRRDKRHPNADKRQGCYCGAGMDWHAGLHRRNCRSADADNRRFNH